MLIILPILAQVATATADCSDRQTQTDLNICAYQDYQAADRALNEAWDEAAASARERGDQTFDRLRYAQRRWLAFRDAHCLAETGPREESGTIWPLLHNSCLAELTRSRTAQLVRFTEWPR